MKKKLFVFLMFMLLSLSLFVFAELKEETEPCMGSPDSCGGKDRGFICQADYQFDNTKTARENGLAGYCADSNECVHNNDGVVSTYIMDTEYDVNDLSTFDQESISSDCYDTCSLAGCGINLYTLSTGETEVCKPEWLGSYDLATWKPVYCGEESICVDGSCQAVDDVCKGESDCIDFYKGEEGKCTGPSVPVADPNNYGDDLSLDPSARDIYIETDNTHLDWKYLGREWDYEETRPDNDNVRGTSIAYGCDLTPTQCIQELSQLEGVQQLCGGEFALMCDYHHNACYCMDVSEDTKLCDDCTPPDCSYDAPCDDTTCVDACRFPMLSCGNLVTSYPPQEADTRPCECCGDGEVQWPNRWAEGDNGQIQEKGKGIYTSTYANGRDEPTWGHEICDYNYYDSSSPDYYQGNQYKVLDRDCEEIDWKDSEFYSSCVNTGCRNDCTCCGDSVFQPYDLDGNLQEECDYGIVCCGDCDPDDPDTWPEGYHPNCQPDCSVLLKFNVKLEFSYEQCVSDDNDWPEYRHDNSNTGHNTYPSPDGDALQESWRTDLPESNFIGTEIIAWDNTLYLVENADQTKISALDTMSGDVLWSRSFGMLSVPGKISPFIYGPNICFAGADRFRCLDRKTGDDTIALPPIYYASDSVDFVNSLPVSYDDMAFLLGTVRDNSIGMGQGVFVGLDLFENGLLWSPQGIGSGKDNKRILLESPVLSSAKDSIIFVDRMDAYDESDTLLKCYDTATGNLRWSFEPPEEKGLSISASPISKDGIVYILGNDEGTIYALNEYTGQLIWSWSSTFYGQPLGNMILLSLEDDTKISYIVSSSGEEYLVILTMIDDTPMLSREVLLPDGYAKEHSSLMASGEKIYLLAENEGMIKVYVLDDDLYVAYSTTGRVIASPITDSFGNIYLIIDDNDVIKLSP